MVAAAVGGPRSQLAPETGGRQARRPPGHRGASLPVPPGAPPRARRRLAHARAPARANYRFPERPAVHPRTRPARAPRASPAPRSRAGLMFPRPGRSVGAAQSPPRRARATRSAVGAKPGAQRSPCVRRGGPDGASSLGARGGDAHSPHFRSPMSRPVHPQCPRGQEGGGAGCRVGAGTGARPTEAGTRPGCGRGSGGGRMQLPRTLEAVAAAASPRDPGGRKRKCRPGALARRVSLRCCPGAPCSSHGLLHGELEPARGLCLLPVSRPALPPTAWLTPLSRRLQSGRSPPRATPSLGAGVRPSPALPRRLPLNVRKLRQA